MSSGTELQDAGAEPGNGADLEVRADERGGPVGQIQDFLGLVTRPSRWREVRLFASPARSALSRRPTDVVLFIGALLTLLVLSMTIGVTPTGFEAAVVDLQANFPDFLDPLWQILYDALTVWAVFLLIVALVRRHWVLLVHELIAGASAFLLALLIARLVEGSWPSFNGVVTTTSPTSYPALRLAVAVALASAASPHLSRPFRYLGRWLVALAMLSGLLLGASRPWGIPAAFSLGIAVAAGIHLAFGSPGGRPSLRQVRLALADLGVDAEPSGQASLRGAGVAVVDARTADGTPLLLKVYGRDAWDGQLITTFWRLLWYRGTDVVLSLTRLQQVEHEAFLTLLAQHRGAPVTPVAAAGRSSVGDAILAVEVPGARLTDLDPTTIDDARLASLWTALRDLHGSGVAHGRIDNDRILIDPSGQPRFADFGEALVVSDVEPVLADRAQMLVTTALLVGHERATAAAIAAIEPDGVAEVIPFLQPAALSGALRDRIVEKHFDLDDLRKEAASAADTEIPELRRLRRVTWGSVLLAVFLFVAGYYLVSSLADIGWSNIVDALQEASLPIVLVALVLAQVPRVTQSFSVMAIAPTRLALGRVHRTPVRHHVREPRHAVDRGPGRPQHPVLPKGRCLTGHRRGGRSARRVRGLHRPDHAPRHGAPLRARHHPAQPLERKRFGQPRPHPHPRRHHRGGRSADPVGGEAITGVGVRHAPDVWVTAHKLRSPRAVVQLLLANVVTELLFASRCGRSCGPSVSTCRYADVDRSSTAVALFAGLMPVPGGIGVTEAALTAGLRRRRRSRRHRLRRRPHLPPGLFYLPPIWGFFAFRWLQRRRTCKRNHPVGPVPTEM